MESDKIQGSDSEEEMTSKSEYIAALRMVHQLDGTILLSQRDLPRYAPGYVQNPGSVPVSGIIKLKKKQNKNNLATFEFSDKEDQTRINTAITKKN